VKPSIKYWILSFLVISLLDVFGQNNDCLKNHRTGKYTYKSRGKTVEVIRTEKEQTEIYNNGKSKLILSVEWTSGSTYVLTFKKGINAPPGCLTEGDWIKVTIVKCYGKQYAAKYTSNKCGEGENVFEKIE
jgi:hypothetical protein